MSSASNDNDGRPGPGERPQGKRPDRRGEPRGRGGSGRASRGFGPRRHDQSERQDRARDRYQERRSERGDRTPHPKRAGRAPRRDRDETPRGRERDQGPPLRDGLDPRALDREVREQLRPLARGVAEQVSLRLVAAGEALDDDPETALAHVLVARRLASRIPAVREAAGIAAYRAGRWQTAVAELRAYHRMSGRQTHLALLADCERALGRPERAVDIYRAADRSRLAADEEIELLIVAAGARADLDQRDAAIAMLQVPQLRSSEPWVARLRYAYADALLAAGRGEEARRWFASAAEADEGDLTDAAQRLLELDGVIMVEGQDEPSGWGDVGDGPAGEAADEPGSGAP